MSGQGGQPFPLSKLAFMYVKKIAQPLARRIASKARSSDVVKRYLCLPPANLYHFYEAKIKFRLMNLGKIRVTKVPKLDEKTAIDLGSNLCAEFVIMSVASAIAFNELRKYKLREREEEARIEAERQEMMDNLDSLSRIVDTQHSQIQTLEKLVVHYQQMQPTCDSVDLIKRVGSRGLGGNDHDKG